MGSNADSNDKGRGSRNEPPAVVALVADLIFASRVRGAAAAAGVDVLTTSRASELPALVEPHGVRLVLVDLDTRGTDPVAAIRALKAADRPEPPRVVAYGSHVRSDLLAAAREAGADHVLARSAFVRELPSLLRG